MSVDEITKLVYAFGITGSVIAVSIFLIRLIYRLTQRVEEMEQTTENVGEITEKVAENMELLEESVQTITGMTKNLKNNLFDPLTDIFSLVKVVRGIIPGMGEGKRGRRRKVEDEDADSDSED